MKKSENVIVNAFGEKIVDEIKTEENVIVDLRGELNVKNIVDEIKEVGGYQEVTQEPKEFLSKSANKKFQLSFIEDYEEETAKQQIEDHLGFPPPRCAAYMMAVKIYVRPDEIREFVGPDGKTRSIYLPAMATANDKYRSCVGLVLSQGPEAYTGKRFEEPLYMKVIRKFFGKWMKPTKKVPWCKVGDWVVFARQAGPQVNYRGVPLTYIPDEAIFDIVSDPEHVTRD